jgi:hypothetical protein
MEKYGDDVLIEKKEGSLYEESSNSYDSEVNHSSSSDSESDLHEVGP